MYNIANEFNCTYNSLTFFQSPLAAAVDTSSRSVGNPGINKNIDVSRPLGYFPISFVEILKYLSKTELCEKFLSG